MFDRIPPRERMALVIAWLAISIAFLVSYLRDLGVLSMPYRDVLEVTVILFIVSLVTVGVAFVLHEMAHKFTAMKYGYWAEFQKDNMMLLVAVIMAALVGVVFAAPGATVIYGSGISREQNGRISAAGPLTNLVLCLPFAALALFSGGGVPGLIGQVGFSVNAMIAAFNMLPISVLDGKKVLSWNPAVFIVLIAVSFGCVYLSLTRFLS